MRKTIITAAVGMLAALSVTAAFHMPVSVMAAQEESSTTVWTEVSIAENDKVQVIEEYFGSFDLRERVTGADDVFEGTIVGRKEYQVSWMDEKGQKWGPYPSSVLEVKVTKNYKGSASANQKIIRIYYPGSLSEPGDKSIRFADGRSYIFMTNALDEEFVNKKKGTDDRYEQEKHADVYISNACYDVIAVDEKSAIMHRDYFFWNREVTAKKLDASAVDGIKYPQEHALVEQGWFYALERQNFDTAFVKLFDKAESLPTKIMLENLHNPVGAVQDVHMGNAEKILDIHDPVVNEESKEVEYSYLYCGYYPQGEVTSDALTADITGAVYNSSGDAVVAGNTYRRVKDGNILHYYRYEPIRWRVLEIDKQTNYAVLISDKVLDCYVYRHDLEMGDTPSCLYKWLNGYETESDSFIGTAFSKNQNALVTTQMSCYTDKTEPQYSGKISIPSTESLFHAVDNPELSAMKTDYADQRNTDINKEKYQTMRWWIESETESIYAKYVSVDGTLCTYMPSMSAPWGEGMISQSSTVVGVRPSVVLDLNRTDAWSTREDAGNIVIDGDVDGNEKVELADAQMVLKAALKLITLSEEQSKAADVNKDSIVELTDAQMILKYSLRIISKFD